MWSTRAKTGTAQVLFLLTTLAIMLCDLGSAHAEERALEDDQVLVVTRARMEVSRVTRYAGRWMPTSGYPMGDIPRDRGACTDLVIRSLRAAGIDLQRLVHEDVVAAPEAYGLTRADAQIDHRRAVVLLKYFQRHYATLGHDAQQRETFLPGDIVFFGRGRTTPHAHVGIVSDRIGPRGLPLVLENGGPRPAESDTLDGRPIIGHFRVGSLDARPAEEAAAPERPARHAGRRRRS